MRTCYATIFCAVVLFCVTVTNVSGNYCPTNCTSCRTNCPYPNPVADMIGYATRCSSLFAIIDYGFGCYPVVNLQYNWYIGRRANLDFYQTYAFIFRLRSKQSGSKYMYYYISVTGDGCPSLRVLTNSNTTSIPETFITHHRATIIVSRFDSKYEAGCTIFTPPSRDDDRRDRTSNNNGEDVPLVTYSIATPPAASFASSSANNNATYSYMNNDIVLAHGLNIIRTAAAVNPFYPEDFLELFKYPPTLCGAPQICNRLNWIKDINSMIKDAGYDSSCISPENSNSGCILSEAVSQGFTLDKEVPFMFTSIVMSIVLPPGCSGLTYLRLAGPIYTDSMRVFYLKLFQLCY